MANFPLKLSKNWKFLPQTFNFSLTFKKIENSSPPDPYAATPLQALPSWTLIPERIPAVANASEKILLLQTLFHGRFSLPAFPYFHQNMCRYVFPPKM